MEIVEAFGIESAPAARGHVVVIDVLRAFTCAAFAFDRGAAAIVLVSTTDEAFAIRRARPDVLLLGEVGGRLIPGFDFANSPHDLRVAGDRLRGRTLVQRTGSGTQGVVSAKQAEAVYLGSLPVASATCRHLQRIGAPTVTLLAMGSPSGSDGPEDVACRKYMADVLSDRVTDRAAAVRQVRESKGGRWALDPAVDWISPGDLDCATSVDVFDFAMPVTREDGLLVARRIDVPHPTRWNSPWPFAVSAIVAKRRLGELASEEIPEASATLIGSGFVTDDLCALVGIRDATGAAEHDRFDRSLASLGLTMDEVSAILVRCLDWARRATDRAVAPEAAAREIGWWFRRDELPFADDCRTLYAAWADDLVRPDPSDEAARLAARDERILELARQFLQRYGPPSLRI